MLDSRRFAPRLAALFLAAAAGLGAFAADSPAADAAGPSASGDPAIAKVAPAAAPSANSPWEWTNVARVVAIGDVHGAYDTLEALLLRTGLIDDKHAWSGGRAHLVLLGDLVDRGPAERKVLDLVRSLEPEAEKAGGGVHLVLGNHEVMTMVRDQRYASPTAMAAWADLEQPADRMRAKQVFAQARNGHGRSAEVDAAFAESFPPGFFGRVRAFGPGGPYAEWLLTHPTMIKINGVLYVHGGLAPMVAELGLAEVNRRVPDNVRTFWKLRDVLARAEGMPAFPSYEDVQRAVKKLLANGNGKSELETAAKSIRKLMDEPAFATDGPLWYRALSLENERAEEGDFGDALKKMGATAIVVGHTPTKGGDVTSRFAGRVLRADVGLWTNNNASALVIENGVPQSVGLGDASGPTPPHAEAPWGEQWAGGIADFTDSQLEQYLETADITAKKPLGKGHRTHPLLVELKQDRVRLRAVYKNVDIGSDGTAAAPVTAGLDPGETVQRYQHEVAAYRLDRMIGLGMVPVTVIRRVDDRAGSLQSWIESAVTLESAQRYGAGEAGARSRAAIPIFDALIGNSTRRPSDILVQPADGHILLIDHAHSFPRTADVSALPSPCTLDPNLATTLRRLDEPSLTKALTPLVDAEQVKAVLARRDAILAKCGGDQAAQ